VGGGGSPRLENAKVWRLCFVVVASLIAPDNSTLIFVVYVTVKN
jgi:hypothetical protein